MNGSPVCVDATLVVRLVADPRDKQVLALWENWISERRVLCAPSLLYFEVTNALYRYQQAEFISPSAMKLALEAALSLPIKLHGEPELHALAFDLAARFSLSATYDAHYLALAQHLGGEFCSADKKLVKRVQSELPWVHFVQ